MKRYMELLRIRQAWVLLLSSYPARTAYSMVNLLIFFKTQQETHSIATAGLAIGVNGLAGAATAGIRGALSDRFGMKWPLRFLVPSYTTMLIVINFVHDRNSILVFSFILGISAPPINLSVRPLWKDAVPKELLRTAYAFDTSFMSSTNIIGPVIATALALSSHPASGFFFASLCMAIGGGSLTIAKITRSWKPERKPGQKVPIFKSKAMQLLALEGAFIGLAFGIFDVAIPSFTTLEGVAHRTSWILGAMGLGNIIGGLVGGLVSKKISPLRALQKTYLFWFISSLPIAFTYPDWSLLLAALILGGVGGSISVFYWEVTEAVRPRGHASGALGWLWTIEGSVAAGGSALGGWISEQYSPRIAFVITSIGLFMGLVIIVSGTKILKDADHLPTEANDLAAISDTTDSTQ